MNGDFTTNSKMLSSRDDVRVSFPVRITLGVELQHPHRYNGKDGMRLARSLIFEPVEVNSAVHAYRSNHRESSKTLTMRKRGPLRRV